MRPILWTLFLLAAGTAQAQQASLPPASERVDNPSELYKLKTSCFDVKKLADCAEELFTGQPVHVAVGSIAPQNGFSAGLAYIGHKTTTNWRITWNSDAVASNNASWRAGFYLKFVNTYEKAPKVEFGTKGRNIEPNLTKLPERPVINLYAQAISLNKLTFFGLGPATTEAGRSFYGMRETIVGASAVKPFYAKLSAAVFGEANGRFVEIRPSLGQPSPSIGQLYTEATAPGLTNQPGTVQFGEGVRIRPIWFSGYLHIDYGVAYQQYFAPGNSNFSFQRLTTDLSHRFAIYKKTTRLVIPRDTNGPDECSVDRDSENPECTVDKYAKHPDCLKDPSKDPDCKAIERDLQGSIGFRFLLSASMTPGGDVVPFYFQRTLGGSDINGNPFLPSYQDYRFRAPDIMLLRESFEHSLWSRLPLGISLMADEGKVALTRGGLGSSPWLHSFAAGLTLRAGGFPQVYLLYAWGGTEGTHTIASVNTSLLGGSTRPSLY